MIICPGNQQEEELVSYQSFLYMVMRGHSDCCRAIPLEHETRLQPRGGQPEVLGITWHYLAPPRNV